jgi:CRP/FNR family cyclic AMP-dependent transcriptional regulator
MIDIDLLLSCGATYKKTGSDEIIFMEGAEAHFYHQLVSGSVRWININEDGREFIQDIIEPGESFGEFPLFDGAVYAGTAVSNKESVIIRILKSTFLQIVKEQPEILMAFTKIFTERLRFKFLLLNELSCFGPEHRISTLINYLKENKKNFCNKCNKVQLTRQQIANMTGLRVETVIRSIKHLQEKGSLTIDKGKVYC